MKKVISLILCFAMVFALTACSQTGGGEASPPLVSVAKRPLAQDCYSDDGQTLLLRYSDDVPGVTVSGNADATTKINEALTLIAQSFATNNDEGGDAGIDNLLAIAKGAFASSPESFTNYALQRTFDVARGDGSVLSLVFESYVNSGGVHPNVVYTTANFSTETGERLTLADIAENPQSLSSACESYIKNLIKDGDYPSDSFAPGYEDAIPGLLADDLWYFSDEGLTFIANIYTLASYAAGSFRFTVPYSEVQHLIKPQYLTPSRPEGKGDLTAAASESVGSVGGMVINEGGEKILFTVKGAVYDVKLCTVNYSDYDGSFIPSATVLYYSDLVSGQTLSLEAYIPDTIPNLQLSFRTSDGEVQKRLISQSGKDGSILLLNYTPGAKLNALEISGLLPYSADLNGDGSAEAVSLETREDENGENARTIVITAENGDVFEKICPITEFSSLWLADVDGDGLREILISGVYLDARSLTLCFKLTQAGAFESIPFAHGGSDEPQEPSDSFYGAVSDINDNDGVVMSGVCDVLGSYMARRHFEYADGALRPAQGSVWALTENDKWLTLKSDLPVSFDIGGSGFIKAGGSVLFTSTDADSWIRFTDSTGATGTVALDRKSSGGYEINGLDEITYFDDIPYAG